MKEWKKEWMKEKKTNKIEDNNELISNVIVVENTMDSSEETPTNH